MADESIKKNCMNCHFFCISSKLSPIPIKIPELSEVDKYYMESDISKRRYYTIEVNNRYLILTDPDWPPRFAKDIFGPNFVTHYRLECYKGIWNEVGIRPINIIKEITKEELDKFLGWRKEIFTKERKEGDCFWFPVHPNMSPETADSLQQRQWLLSEANKDRELTRDALKLSDKANVNAKRSNWISLFVAILALAAFIFTIVQTYCSTDSVHKVEIVSPKTLPIK